MADRWTAIHAFWNGFGLPAYDENTVPETARIPYITYQASVAEVDEKIPLTASIWYRSNSWADVSQKVEEISDLIGGGFGYNYGQGMLWVTKGIPFGQRLEDPDDSLTRRVVLQISAEFL